jgi:hypothetical protein
MPSDDDPTRAVGASAGPMIAANGADHREHPRDQARRTPERSAARAGWPGRHHAPRPCSPIAISSRPRSSGLVSCMNLLASRGRLSPAGDTVRSTSGLSRLYESGPGASIDRASCEDGVLSSCTIEAPSGRPARPGTRRSNGVAGRQVLRPYPDVAVRPGGSRIHPRAFGRSRGTPSLRAKGRSEHGRSAGRLRGGSHRRGSHRDRSPGP